MNSVLYAAGVAGAAALAATVWFCQKHRCRETGLLCVRETWMTAVMGLMLLALGGCILAMKLGGAALAGTDRSSYLAAAGFALVCCLMGDATLIYTLVKAVVVYEDRVEAISPLGKKTTIFWADVVKVEKPLTRRAYILTDRDGTTVSVSGTNAACAAFADIARGKVRSATGAALLRQVERRLGGKL